MTGKLRCEGKDMIVGGSGKTFRSEGPKGLRASGGPVETSEQTLNNFNTKSEHDVPKTFLAESLFDRFQRRKFTGGLQVCLGFTLDTVDPR